MEDKEKFTAYLGVFLLSVVIGSTAVFAGLNLRKKRRIKIRWRKVGGLKKLKPTDDGDLFALVIGGVLLYVGTVGETLEGSVRKALSRKYPDRRKIPRNIKVHVGEVAKAPETVKHTTAPLLVAMLQPPWNTPEEGNYRGEVPVEVRNEGDVPPGIKPLLRL